MFKTILISCLAIACLFILGCGPTTQQHFTDDTMNNDIVADVNLKPSSINAEVYLDATTSMSGFAKQQTSVYIQFISELEAAVNSGTRNSKLDYFKFGTRVKQISRNEAVFQNPDFYKEKGIFERTCIDSVLVKADSTKSMIIMTDLFQSEGDINQVVGDFKKSCFAKGLDVGILMVHSDFDGIVYDAKVPPYAYKSTENDISTYRPFYVIFVGKASDFNHIINSLKSTAVKNVIFDSNIMLLPNKIVSGYAVSLEKKKGSTRFVFRKYPGKNSFKNIFLADYNKGEPSEQLMVNIEVKPVVYLPPLDLSNIHVSIDRLEESIKNGSQTSVSEDFEMINGEHDGNKVSFSLAYKPQQDTKNAQYRMRFSVSPLSGFSVPQAFIDNSSVNPNANSDANKTLNLEKFMTDLIRSYASLNSVNIAKSYLYLNIK